MAIKRQGRFYSQERISVPAIRNLESAVSADFDSVLRDMMGGSTNAYVLSGFYINIGVSSFSQTADNLTLNTLNGTLLNTTATESGTLLKVTGSATETLNTSNARVSGSFIAGSTNYISINYIRKADSSTDTVFFYDKNSQTEFSKLLPVDTILDYQIVINTTGFSNNVPIAIVQTNSGNVPTQITDSRNMFFRLGTGGLTPNQFNSYPWLNGRTEPGTATTSSASNPFTGADKNIGIFKDWMDAVMTSIKEVKGTSYWFASGSGGSNSGLSLLTVNEDANLSTWTGSGNLKHDISQTGTLISDSVFHIRNLVSDAVVVVESFTKTLTAGQVLFLNLVRYVDISGNVTIMPSGTLPGALVGLNSQVVQASSVGQFVSLTNGSGTFGDWIKSKNDNDRYFRQVANFYDSAGSLTNSTNATYILLDSPYNINGSSTGTQQLNYNQGYYGQSLVLTSSRVNILNSYNIQNVYWLAYMTTNSDNSINVRNMGRMVPGEIRPISENTSTNVLNFIGSSVESATFPTYATSIAGGITSPTQFNYPGASTDNLTVRASELSSGLANKAQDKNVTILGGATVSSAGGLLTWNSSITVVINGPGSGVTNFIPSGSANLTQAYSCAYVTIDRNTNAASLAVSITTMANVPLTENTVVFVRRHSTTDLYVGVGGVSYLIPDGSDSGTTGVTPAAPSAFGSSGISKYKQEVPVGAINSINKSFTLSSVPISNTSCMVFKNGLIQGQGASFDYSITNTTNVVFNVAPLTNDEIVAVYPSGGTLSYVWIQSITTVSTTVTSVAISPNVSYTLGTAVYVNGLMRIANVDFTSSANAINFAFNIVPGDVVIAVNSGVNDNEIYRQGLVNETVSANRSMYSNYFDIIHPMSTVLSMDGVSQFACNNTVGLTTGGFIVNDYIRLYPGVFQVNTSSLTSGGIINVWSR